jgi:hypothetical protein
VQGGGDLHGVLGVDGVDGFDPKGLGPVEEHGEGSGRAVGGIERKAMGSRADSKFSRGSIAVAAAPLPAAP